jgi:hypothetical protein
MSARRSQDPFEATGTKAISPRCRHDVLQMQSADVVQIAGVGLAGNHACWMLCGRILQEQGSQVLHASADAGAVSTL